MAEQEAEELVAKAEKKLKVRGEGSVLCGSALARRALVSLGTGWSRDCAFRVAVGGLCLVLGMRLVAVSVG